MLYRNRVFKWWMGPIVGAVAGVLIWIRTDNARHEDVERFYTMLGTIVGCTLAGVIVAGLDFLYSRSEAKAEISGVPPLSLLGHFFALAGILFCWAPVVGLVLNATALYASRQRRGWLRNCNWLALGLGIASTAMMIVAIALGK